MKIRKEIEKILDRNIIQVEYEPHNIDYVSLIDELIELINKPVETTNEQPKEYKCVQCGLLVLDTTKHYH